MGVNAAWRLAQVLPKASVEAGYTFGLVETVVEGTRPNRSNVTMSFGYALTRALYVHGGALFTKTHSGLTAFEVGTAPPDQRVQADRSSQDALLAPDWRHIVFDWLCRSVRRSRAVRVGSRYSRRHCVHRRATWYFDFSRLTLLAFPAFTTIH
jgi:hypothetical protein